MLSTLLVDDEKRAVALLKRLLEETGEFSSVRHAFSADSALEAVKAGVPDLIFLDIRMPNKDGFAFLQEVKGLNINTDLVIVTAYDQYMRQALKHHAFDYLTKPVIRTELQECIDQYKQRRKGLDFSSRLSHFLDGYEPGRKVRFNTRSGFFKLDPSSILYCEADGNYTNIVTFESTELCTLNLGHVREMLPSSSFVRLGRSFLINIKFVFRVDRKSGEVAFEKGGKQKSVSLPVRQVKELDKLL